MKKYIFLLTMLFLVGCDDDGPQLPELNDGDREAMLRSLGENVIVPGFERSAQHASSLETAVNAFVANPSAQTLDAAQAAWTQFGKSWKHVEMYQQGLLDQERPDSLIYKIDLGAANPRVRTSAVDLAALNAAIASAQPITLAFVEAMPAKLQGIPVIEQLLFGGSDEEVIALYTTASDAQNRKAYLTNATLSLRTRFDNVYNNWKPSGGNFLEVFANQYGTDLGSSLGMLVEDMVALSESMKNEKIGRPLGMSNSQNPQPDSVEARLSVQSMAFFLENVVGMESAFTADAYGRTGTGIDALLDHLEAKVGDVELSTAVKSQLQTIREKAALITLPLPQAVVSERTQVRTLYDECLVLVKLLKVDVVTQLGVMITTVENDGD
jgi:predicted lipoprotein